MSMLTSFLRKTGLNKPGKALVSVAKNVLPVAIPGGAIVRTAVGAASAASAVRSLTGGGGGGGGYGPQVFTGSGPGPDFGDLADLVRRVVPGGRTGRGRVAMVNGQCPRGYHPDKKTRTYCVRNRRMNPMNGRAAMRAARRLRGGEKMLRQVYTLLHKKSPGKVIPKRGGKR